MFKDIDKALHKAIMERFLPVQTRFYYQEAYREMNFDLDDAVNQIVKVSSYFRARMRTDRVNTPIIRNRVILLDALPDGSNALVCPPSTNYVLEDGSTTATASNVNSSILATGETQVE